MDIKPGRYVLKIKIEKNDINSTYVINYNSNNNFQMKEIYLSKQETSLMMRSAMVSIMGRTPRVSLDKEKRQD